MMQGPSEAAVQEGAQRLSLVHFLIALVVLLIVMPFVDQLPNGELIEAALMTVVLLSAALAVGGRRPTLLAAAILVMPALVAIWLDHFRPGLIPKEFHLAASIAFVAFVIVHLLGYILRAPSVNAEVLCAAVATYLMLAILWAFAYTLTARLVPNSFAFLVQEDPIREMARFEALYFSFSTLTTVDYGDVVPASNVARMLAMFEAVTGVFFLAILIARLVALYSGGPAVPSRLPAEPSANLPKEMLP